MKLGFFVNAYRFFSLDYALESIVKHGYQGVELWAKGDHITPFDQEDLWRETRKKIDDLGLELYGISAHLDFVAPEQAKREMEIKKFSGVIRMANVMGVKKVHTASGGLYTNITYDQQEQYFLEAMNILGRQASDEGIKIVLEAEPEKWLSKPDQVIDLIDNKLDRNVFRVLVDTGHAFGVGLTPPEYIDIVKNHLELIHMDDVRKNDFPHRHLIPGEGDIDYKELFGKLDEIGYDGWISMELNKHNDFPDEAAGKAKKFIDDLNRKWN